MKIIDTRGQLCPAPLIMTKKAIANSSSEETFEIISDNDTARCNLMEYLNELGITATCTSHGNEFHIAFNCLSAKKTSGNTATEVVKQSGSVQQNAAASSPEQFCATGHNNTALNSYMVAFSSNVMGSGNDELGAILMRSYINSLGELEWLPSVIVMYNAGVKLAVTGTDTADSLAKLATRGVEIIVCGTCVDFYGIKEKLAVGKISNMYKISTLLSEVSKIVYP